MKKFLCLLLSGSSLAYAATSIQPSFYISITKELDKTKIVKNQPIFCDEKNVCSFENTEQVAFLYKVVEDKDGIGGSLVPGILDLGFNLTFINQPCTADFCFMPYSISLLDFISDTKEGPQQAQTTRYFASGVYKSLSKAFSFEIPAPLTTTAAKPNYSYVSTSSYLVEITPAKK